MEGKVKASITSQSLCVIAEEVVITLQIGPFFHLGTRVGVAGVSEAVMVVRTVKGAAVMLDALVTLGTRLIRCSLPLNVNDRCHCQDECYLNHWKQQYEELLCRIRAQYNI